jgi:hypothetical protein
MVYEERNRSMSEKLDDVLTSLKDSQEGKKKKKEVKFELPFNIKSGAKAKIKKNYCVVQVINDNGSIDFKMLPIHNNMVHLKENDSYHVATADYILRYKEYPFMIVPSFDSEPYNIKKNFEEADKEGRLTTWQKYYINVMNLSALKPKMQLGGKAIFLLVIGAIVFIAFMVSKYGS